jgi:hypothetical protein
VKTSARLLVHIIDESVHDGHNNQYGCVEPVVLIVREGTFQQVKPGFQVGYSPESLNPEGQPLVRSMELDELTLGSLGVRVTDEGGHVVDRQLAVKNPVTGAKELSEVVDSPRHMLELALQITPLPGQFAVLPRAPPAR